MKKKTELSEKVNMQEKMAVFTFPPDNGESKGISFVIGLLLTFAILSAIYSYNTKQFGGPDEMSHIIYIRFLAIDHKLPEIAHTANYSVNDTATHEGHQPPLYYFIMSIPYAIMHFAGVSDDSIFIILRYINILFGVFWIYTVYLISSLILKKKELALFSAAVVVLLPTSSFMSGVINNDALISALFTLSLYNIFKLTYTNLDIKRVIYLAITTSLAILVKPQGLLLLPITFIAVFLFWRKSKYSNTKQIIKPALAYLAIIAVLAGWWLIRSYIIFGKIVPESLSNPLLKNGLVDVFAQPGNVFLAAINSIKETYGYYIAPFWLMAPFVDNGVYYNAAWIISAVIGLIAVISAKKSKEVEKGLFIASIIIAFTILLTWLRYIFIIDFGANMQGRLFMPVGYLSGVITSAAFGVLYNRRKLWIAVISVSIAVLLIFNGYVLHFMKMFYAGGG
jgi:4-amino-4-deoxy-L-arabinose transferase-like glycosyltransferase